MTTKHAISDHGIDCNTTCEMCRKDIRVVNGQGSVGLELLEQEPDLDAIVVLAPRAPVELARHHGRSIFVPVLPFNEFFLLSRFQLEEAVLFLAWLHMCLDM